MGTSKFTARVAPGRLSPALVAAGLLVVAVAVRLLLLVKADWMLDYDEAMIGLMGIDITKGARPVFLYGQPYLGAVQSYLLAGVFEVVGATRQSLKLVPLIVSLLWMATTYVLVRRLSDRRAAALAASLVAVPPLYVTVATSKAWGATVETMALGNLILLIAINAVDEVDRKRCTVWCALLGLVVGFAFRLHWLGAYYVVAALAYLLLRRASLVLEPRAWMALPLFFVGGLPLWLYNLRHDWATFRYLLGGSKPIGDEVGTTEIAADLFSRLIPRVLGSESPVWPWLGWIGVVIATAVLLLLVAHCLRQRLCGMPSPAEVVVLFVVAVPVLYLASGFGRAALNPWGVDATGRYVVPLFAAVPLALGLLCNAFPRPVLVAAAVVLLAVNLAGIANADGPQAFQSPYYNRSPSSFAPVIAALREERVRHVWTDIGLGQPLMFESSGEIVTADYLDHQAGGLPRFPAALASVQRADRAAYLVAILPGQVGPLEREFQRLGVPYRRRDIGSLALFIPERKVEPAEVVAGLGMQY